MRTFSLSLLGLLLICALPGGCTKEPEPKPEPVNMYLLDKPLSVIQEYIDGKWNLWYATGGIAGGTYLDKDDSYVIFSPDHIIVGDAVRGIVTDTTLIWNRIKAYGDSIYVYTHPGTSIGKIVIEIHVGILSIGDYLADGFIYYFTR